MAFNATFNNISVISWSPRENHQPAVSHLQTLSHNAVSSTGSFLHKQDSELTTFVVIGTYCTGTKYSCKSNYDNPSVNCNLMLK